ncbi:di-heme oxidoredictase family protein [Schlesneria sp. DSM 10557]|uniref:di-heme oxidoredictase family protein n=1 Tax=Schlesneria sp. DSM 10557 TaxID=3044399 RepID=UPI0035A02E90
MFRSAGIRPPQTVTQYCFAGIAMGAIWLAESAVVAWYCQPTEAQIAHGRALFEHKWTENDPLSGKGDGLGPVFNATSCVECHFQGTVGGAGPNKFNVKTFEILPTKKEPLPLSGVVHASAVRPDLLESASTVRRHNPIVKNGMKVIGGCRIDIVDFDPIHYDTSNTPALFGAGQIDKIREVAIRGQSLRRSVTSLTREFDLDFKSTPTGRVRILPDGRIGKFGWKAQFATLKEFVAAACAGELGLSNHLRKQHVAQEYREDTDAELDMTRQQFAALVAYVETIPAPRRERPSDATQTTVVERGEALFSSVGCADCHIPDLDGTQGIYSDFSLHSLTDEANDGYSKVPDVPLPDDHPKLNEWKTPALWGVADSAPYFHDGGSPDLPSAIERHGGAARHVREKYRALPQPDQQALVSFLKTLRAPLP